MASFESLDGVQVFSATFAEDRARLGDRIQAWLAAHPGIQLVDHTVVQSSDEAFHCLSIVLFYQKKA